MEEKPKLERGQLLTILTTEHFALQGARTAALSDMQGRATLFTTAVSSTLVALALVANIAKLGPTFQAFTFILLPTLYAFGVITFLRVVQISLEDVLRARGLARIRHWYIEQAPELEDYLLTSTHDDWVGMTTEMGVQSGLPQMLMTTETVVAFVASVLLGVFAGVVGVLSLHRSLPIAVVLGVSVTAGSIAVLTFISMRMWTRIDRDHPPLFPSD